MKANNFPITASKGKRTTLDKAYSRHITNVLETLDKEKEERWETYNVIIQELIDEGKIDYFKEIKYRLTDGEDPNKVMLEIIERDGDEAGGLIWILKRRLEEYLEDDYLKSFC
jgi:EAL domain-containing protein (putative c-di-GMP-specific phosphodiesterase class I)